MTYESAGNYLLALPRFAEKGIEAFHPGLARMEALMDAMGRPHEAFDSVHVAGTNGKGSTASMLAAIATASGCRVGLHTSPHLFYLGERLRLDGVSAPKAWIADTVTRYRTVLDDLRPSFFETTTALSFLYFAEKNVDLAVVEVGLGGRLDATNVVHPRLSLITSIGFDHTALLGNTLEAIAQEKAGIIKPGVPVLISADQPEVVDAIRNVAARNGAPLYRIQDEVQVLHGVSSLEGSMLRVRTPLRHYETLEVGLPGLHQQTNAMLALRAAEMLFADANEHAIYTGLREVRRLTGLRGRLEVLQRHPLIVADVAHNVHSLKATLDFMQAHHDGSAGRLFVVLGAMQDKDISTMARYLADAQARVYPLRLSTERAMLPGELTTVLREHGVTVVDREQEQAWWTWFQREANNRDALLITGSHQVVAQIPDLKGVPDP